MTRRSFSVVVNTVDRARSLAKTLEALEQLDHPSFEVVVVNGPSTDATDQVLERWAPKIKIGRCENRNLSESRNLGIALAAGEIVAFIDDDAYPDPAWLDRLEEAFADPEVAAAGGPVHSHDGVEIQAWYTRQDRLGHPWTSKEPDPLCNPSLVLAFPKSRQFVCTIGTNSSFRRDRLLEIGGFDEEFEYYMDETDVCCRLVDRGYVIRALDDGFVYHKYLPNDIRGGDRTVRDFYQVLKSVFYLILKHGSDSYSPLEVSTAIADTGEFWRRYLDEHIALGELTAADREKFETDANRASGAAFSAFTSASTRTRTHEWFASKQMPFRRFPTIRDARDKLHICFFSQEYPPRPVNGIGRVVHELAEGLAREGHLVRVLTTSENRDSVDLECGVWVHRFAAKEHPLPGVSPSLQIPAHIWDYSATLLDELIRIHDHRPVDVVQVPNWDSEGIAVVLDGRFRHVLGLYTPLKSVAKSDPRIGAALSGGDPVLEAMVELERYVYEHSPNILACGPAIVEEVERTYELALAREHLGLVPHGLSDESHRVQPRAHPGRLEVLFAGRLEARKGVDTLLDCIPSLLEQFPAAVFNLVGDDSLPGPSGRTPREDFEKAHPDLAGHVVFRGRVGDEQLRQFYANCDVFVAPSRFESFGLVLVEAMMFSKPVVATEIGGLEEVVEDHANGLLVPPGDSWALREALSALLASEELRTRFGLRSRELYLSRFGSGAMVKAVNAYFDSLVGTTAASAREPAPR